MRRWVHRVAICGLLAGSVVWQAAPAWAHGERAQESFIRVRAATFFDVRFSEDTIGVGEPLTITGKVKILEAWPRQLGEPTMGAIQAVALGPVLLLKERIVNGAFVPGSMMVERGGVYDFSLTLVGRRPGRYHVHPGLAIHTVGTLLGPGRWITVEDTGRPFTNPVTLYDGRTVDLERYGLGEVIGWHLITLVLGGAWLLYWLVRPVIARAALVGTAGEGQLVTPRDRRVGIAFAVGTIVLLLAGSLYTRIRYPVTIPQQVHRIEVPPAPEPAEVFADATVASATYDPSSGTLELDLQVTNDGDLPMRLTRFATANLSFEPGDPGVTVVPDEPIPPGATRDVAMRIQGEVWEEQRLIPIQEASISIAGLMFFEDDAGSRAVVEVESPIVPEFQ